MRCWRPLAPSCEVFQWHDYGCELPEGAVPLARSERAPQQAYRWRRRVWAVQFHIEVDADSVECWTVEGGHELDAKGFSREQILADTAREAEAYVRLAHDVGHRFLAVAESHAGVRAA